jgi:prolyl-tRNA editing enzyme YbaK/EbsC (Cys-tRNA(Pro) deacylase)
MTSRRSPANGSNADGSSQARVEKALLELGIRSEIKTFDQGTYAAEDAANAIGCGVAQIVKSLIFKASQSGDPVLVLVSGANRGDLELVAETVGEPFAKADAGFVRKRTGLAIGGVAPIGQTEPLRVLIDLDLEQYQEIWAAAGSPKAVFRLTPAQLILATAGDVIRVH